jgi:hypothetical protein
VLLPKGEIIADIEAQIRRIGGEHRDWCVGVAKDPRVPLFETHVVEDRHDGWLYREAFTAVSAREVKDHFVVECGSAEDPESCDGGRLVYAYRKAPVESPAVKAATSIQAHS